MIRSDLISACLDWVYLIISDMSNQWFQFRKFLIRQDRSAMKVGTDGVLLGAWTAFENIVHVLDIGTGTGLIALMMVQRNPVISVTALEIDPEAAVQAAENVQESPWRERIEVVCADFRCWNPGSRPGFDLIVCNPPFFTRSLKNPDAQKAKARHDDDLTLSDLIPKAAGLLATHGRLSLILPCGRVDAAMAVAGESGLFLSRRTDVRGNAGSAVKRVMMEWTRERATADHSELIIESVVRGVYTDDYKSLTAEFYL
jgi:tRNA1Val (adenine37-N6)-methyltransferase